MVVIDESKGVADGSNERNNERRIDNVMESERKCEECRK